MPTSQGASSALTSPDWPVCHCANPHLAALRKTTPFGSFVAPAYGFFGPLFTSAGSIFEA
jgi:hypothetical protein